MFSSFSLTGRNLGKDIHFRLQMIVSKSISRASRCFLRHWWYWRPLWKVMKMILRSKAWFPESNVPKGQELGLGVAWPFYFIKPFPAGQSWWLIKAWAFFFFFFYPEKITRFETHTYLWYIACALPLCSFGLQFLLWNFCWTISELWYFYSLFKSKL